MLVSRPCLLAPLMFFALIVGGIHTQGALLQFVPLLIPAFYLTAGLGLPSTAPDFVFKLLHLLVMAMSLAWTGYSLGGSGWGGPITMTTALFAIAALCPESQSNSGQECVGGAQALDPLCLDLHDDRDSGDSSEYYDCGYDYY